MAQFSDLLGKTLKEIDGAVIGSEQITFITTEGESFGSGTIGIAAKAWRYRTYAET